MTHREEANTRQKWRTYKSLVLFRKKRRKCISTIAPKVGEEKNEKRCKIQ